MTRTSNLFVKRIPVLVLALPLACVFDKQLDPQAGDSGDTGSSSSGEEATTVEDPSDPSTATGNSASTVVPTDDSGTTTEGFDAACGTDQTVLMTEIDAVQDSALWDSLGYYNDEMGAGIEFGIDDAPSGWRGMVLMRASTEELTTPGPMQGDGYVREPPDSPSEPNAWYCFDDTSTFLDTGDEITVSLEGLRRFGACPGGEPQEGTITACFGDESCGGEEQLDVALTDTAYVTALPGAFSSGFGAGELLARHNVGDGPSGSAGLLGFHATDYTPESPGMHVSPLDDVFFISPVDQADGGAIYCAGEGSTLTYDGESGDLISASFTNVTRLGSCADDDEGSEAGTGQFCANFGGE